MNIEDYIEIQPGVRSGKPCFKGTRITVYDVLEYLAGGMTDAQLLSDFPALTPQHVRAARAFAAASNRDSLPPLPTWRSGGMLVDVSNRDELYRAMEEE